MYYTLNGLNNYIFTHRALRICFIVFLILAIIFVGFATQVHAFAPALLPALYVVVAAALGAAGVTFATNDEAQAAAANFLESLSESDAASWTALATEYSSSIAEGSFVSHLSAQAISNVSGWIGNLFNSETSTLDIAAGEGFSLSCSSYDFSGIQIISSADYFSVPSSDRYNAFHSYATWLPSDFDTTFFMPEFDLFGPNGCHFDSNDLRLYGGGVDRIAYPIVGYFIISYPNNSIRLGFCCIGPNGGICTHYTLDDGSGTNAVIVPSSSISLQADTTFFPNEVIESAPTTTFPANTASQALTTDIPLNIPASLDDVVTNTGALRGELTNTNTLLGTISAGIAAIGAAITSFFDTSQFQLDFDPFKIGLTSVFPFCIPFDFVRMVRTVAVNASGFSFDIDLHTDYFDLDHTVDLTPFRIPILFFRFICDFWFCFILISRTRDWIKW